MNDLWLVTSIHGSYQVMHASCTGSFNTHFHVLRCCEHIVAKMHFVWILKWSLLNAVMVIHGFTHNIP